MPQYDSQKVWQRVHASAEPAPDIAHPLLALVPQLCRCAGLCPEGQPLHASFQAQASALSGICALLGSPVAAPSRRSGNPPPTNSPGPSHGRMISSPGGAARRPPSASSRRGSSLPPKSAPSQTSADLRACYTLQCQALAQYQALCGHPEYGPAFQALIPLAQKNCLAILSALGG